MWVGGLTQGVAGVLAGAIDVPHGDEAISCQMCVFGKVRAGQQGLWLVSSEGLVGAASAGVANVPHGGKP